MIASLCWLVGGAIGGVVLERLRTGSRIWIWRPWARPARVEPEEPCCEGDECEEAV